MLPPLRKLIVAFSCGFATLCAGPSRALTEDIVYPPPGGWGNASGISSGLGITEVTLPGVSISGRRDNFSPIYQINVPYAGHIPTPFLDLGGQDPSAAPDPAKQKACIDGCDQRQKIAKDLCDVAAAKASASGTISAIGIGFAVGAVVTWKASLIVGAPVGFGTYVVANQLARDHAATLNLACVGKAAQEHVNCLTGTCKFSG